MLIKVCFGASGRYQTVNYDLRNVLLTYTFSHKHFYPKWPTSKIQCKPMLKLFYPRTQQWLSDGTEPPLPRLWLKVVFDSLCCSGWQCYLRLPVQRLLPHSSTRLWEDPVWTADLLSFLLHMHLQRSRLLWALRKVLMIRKGVALLWRIVYAFSVAAAIVHRRQARSQTVHTKSAINMNVKLSRVFLKIYI